MNNQANQAVRPVNSIPWLMATALLRPMVAMVPLSKYLNGRVGWPLSCAQMLAAACLPCCMATGATPGKGLPLKVWGWT